MAGEPKPKKLLSSPIIGEQGVAVAKLLVLEMGSTWHSTNPLLETGIDGWIELRDPETGVMLNRWIAAQCKAHQGPFEDESDQSFSFKCDERDLSYWADGSSPVVLIVIRPRQREAWWRPIPKIEGEKGRIKIQFDKARDALTPSSWEQFLELSTENAPGELNADQSDGGIRSADGLVFPFLPLYDNRPFPAIPISLHGPAGELNAIALLDSGADSSCFPYSFAKALGIDLSACDKVQALEASGSSAIHIWPDHILGRVAENEIPLMAMFAPTPVPLLGRSDFFAHFAVSIDQSQQTVTLSR